MAINQIKVANEAKQDITISKADQILGRLTDQTVIAKTVKSVQRGFVQFTNDSLVDNYYKVVAYISSVDMSKCDVFFSMAANENLDGGVYLYSMTSSSLTFHVGIGESRNTVRAGRVSWQVIEYY